MAKLTTIIDRRTGEARYPITSTRAVFDERGVDLETLLDEQKRETANALKGYATATALTEGLAGKQDAFSTTADLRLTGDNVLGLTDMAKKRLFIDLWNEACGQWGRYDPENAPDTEHPFYLNELWLTYEEAVQTTIYGNHFGGGLAYASYSGILIRTNLPPVDIVGGQGRACNMMFLGQSKLEVARVCSSTNGSILLAANAYAMFGSCSKLHTVLGIIDMFNIITSGQNSTPFHSCPLLKNVKIRNLRVSLILGSCAAISLESLSYLVANAANTSAITVTVHPDVYAKLTDETNEEWHAVLEAAAEKNITFATV